MKKAPCAVRGRITKTRGYTIAVGQVLWRWPGSVVAIGEGMLAETRIPRLPQMPELHRWTRPQTARRAPKRRCAGSCFYYGTSANSFRALRFPHELLGTTARIQRIRQKSTEVDDGIASANPLGPPGNKQDQLNIMLQWPPWSPKTTMYSGTIFRLQKVMKPKQPNTIQISATEI